jgi:hypothetical protein
LILIFIKFHYNSFKTGIDEDAENFEVIKRDLREIANIWDASKTDLRKKLSKHQQGFWLLNHQDASYNNQ